MSDNYHLPLIPRAFTAAEPIAKDTIYHFEEPSQLYFGADAAVVVTPWTSPRVDTYMLAYDGGSGTAPVVGEVITGDADGYGVIISVDGDETEGFLTVVQFAAFVNDEAITGSAGFIAAVDGAPVADGGKAPGPVALTIKANTLFPLVVRSLHVSDVPGARLFNI